jgi:uncharacterized protein Yka (UPF0111/DUF47 family)
MNMLDMISEPLLFAQQSHEFSKRVHESASLVSPLMEALLSQDRERMRSVRDAMSRIRDETIPVKLALYDQIKELRFRSPGAYAFSQYLACQDRIAELAQDFADLLAVREITLPAGLQAEFKALAVQVVDVCERAMTPSEILSSETEAPPAEADLEKAAEMLQGITDSSRQAKQSSLKCIQRICSHEAQLDAATTMFLDKVCDALRQLVEAAERTGDHLRLIFPQA